MIDIIPWIAFILSFAGTILNAYKKILCWPVWIMACLVWLYIAIYKQDYPTIALWATFMLGNIWGWVAWAKEK